MQTGKPLISILMAVYEPRMDWLREQLCSLEAQTYPNLRLYIRDDCSTAVPLEAIETCVRSCVTRIPFTIERNERNLGSNLTFERLTQEAEGEYFAYCDQDDIWLRDKLSVLQANIEAYPAELVCSDVRVIGGSGETVAESITKIRRRHRFISGGPVVFRSLLTRNFVIGCTMLVRRETAQAAVPFVPEMVHDHWIAVMAASRGSVLSLPQPLICYRIHGGNQTGVLMGISSRRDYIEGHVIDFERRMQCICQRFPGSQELDRVCQWARARMDYAVYNRRGAAVRLWRLRDQNRLTTLFELLALKAPERLFQQALRLARRSG